MSISTKMTGPASKKFAELVEQHARTGMPRAKAVQKVRLEEPVLHREMLREANPNSAIIHQCQF